MTRGDRYSLGLTAREAEVLALLPTWRTVPEIAAYLGISVHTVRSQVTSVYRKLGVSSRGEAVTAARNRGYIP